MRVYEVGFSSCSTIRHHDHRQSGLHEFHYFLEGEGEFWNAGQRFALRPGSLFYSRPWEDHRASTPGARFRFYYLLFSVEPDHEALVASLGDQFPGQRPLMVGRGHAPVFEDIRRRSTSPESLARRSADFRLLTLACDLAGSGPSTPQASRYVDEALGLMQASIHTGLDLDDLAGKLGIDKSYFVRLFKRAVGQPPMRYFLGLRLDTAKHRLRHGDESLRSIAVDLGFHDEFHFSHQFKSHVGVSPQAFRHSANVPVGP